MVFGNGVIMSKSIVRELKNVKKIKNELTFILVFSGTPTETIHIINSKIDENILMLKQKQNKVGIV